MQTANDNIDFFDRELSFISVAFDKRRSLKAEVRMAKDEVNSSLRQAHATGCSDERTTNNEERTTINWLFPTIPWLKPGAIDTGCSNCEP